MRQAPNPDFFALGTNDARALNWRLWTSATVGTRLRVATLNSTVEAVVLELPRTTEDGEVMVVSVRGRRMRLRLFRSASAGYYDDHPDERFPGCDRDLGLDGLSARLVEAIEAEQPCQLALF